MPTISLCHPADSNTKSRSKPKRPRLPLACVRCRLKKQKCQSSTPCIHCAKAGVVCSRSRKKRPHGSDLPAAASVDFYEHQIRRLSAGICELYQRLPHDGEESNSNRPGNCCLTVHDIIDQLGLPDDIDDDPVTAISSVGSRTLKLDVGNDLQGDHHLHLAQDHEGYYAPPNSLSPSSTGSSPRSSSSSGGGDDITPPSSPPSPYDLATSPDYSNADNYLFPIDWNNITPDWSCSFASEDQSQDPNNSGQSMFPDLYYPYYDGDAMMSSSLDVMQ